MYFVHNFTKMVADAEGKKEPYTVSSITSDYVAMKLAEARRQDLVAESNKDRLVMTVLKQARPVIRLPRIRIHQN